MTRLARHLDATTEPDLLTRCASLGIVLLGVDDRGVALTRQTGAGHENETSLHETLRRSPLLDSAIGRVVPRWNEQPEPQFVEAWPGCWLIPIPILTRRHRNGYLVALVLTEELVEAEQFSTLCDAARLDRQALAQTFIQNGARRSSDVPMLARTLLWMAGDLDRLSRQEFELDDLSSHVADTYEELSLVYKLTANMTVTQDPAAFLQEACEEIQQVIGFGWVAMQLTDTEVRLKDLGGRFLSASLEPDRHKAVASVARRLIYSNDITGPTILDDTAKAPVAGLDKIARRLLVVPVVLEGQVVAVLLGADKSGGESILSIDAKLVTSTTQNMAIFLQNAMLYDDMQDMFMGTLHAMIAAIDAKDTYTCGHSERVAWISRELAQAAGLDPQAVERVYLSGLVHDVGKIGVPEHVLTKPGKLTREEFEMIKTHPEIGGRIIKDIRQMSDLLPGVLHHHERWDGKGYPYGLSGEGIPLLGRIICLADSFDAMSSDRTYRSAMSMPQVLEEIHRCSGTQFDPDLVEVFITLNFASFFEMIAEHRDRLSPLDKTLRGVSCD
jgi:HD-GYP domain-containing protein (c-di-GMP phosphodiesterase class II)